MPLNLANYNLTSRSAIESYQSCPRKRYLNYFYNGTGIQQSNKNLALVTGGEVHTGIGNILAKVRLYKKLDEVIIESIINESVELAKSNYLLVNKISGPGLVLDSQQEYTKSEQLALIEALIRCWSLIELPKILANYDIVDVERELLYPLTESILLQSKCDCLLREKGTKNYFIYSLKTSKGYWYKTERSYRKDLQGITEILAVEKWFEEQNKEINDSLLALEKVEVGTEIRKISDYLNKLLLPERVMGVKFCYLIKGDRRDKNRSWGNEKQSLVDEPNSNSVDNVLSNWITDSPLLYGYQKFTPSGIEYAHSDKTIKPENKSGFGKLGKGWEGFTVWDNEEIGGIKGWISKIFSGGVQPELGNILEKIVVSPQEYFRNMEELEARRRQVISLEEDVFLRVSNTLPTKLVDQILLPNSIDVEFPQNTGSCHYPYDCQYLPICFLEEPFTGKPVGIDVRENPLSSDMFVSRVPHHEPERIRLIQIENQNQNGNPQS